MHKKSRTALFVTLTRSHSATRLSFSDWNLGKPAAIETSKDPRLSAPRSLGIWLYGPIDSVVKNLSCISFLQTSFVNCCVTINQLFVYKKGSTARLRTPQGYHTPTTYTVRNDYPLWGASSTCAPCCLLSLRTRVVVWRANAQACTLNSISYMGTALCHYIGILLLLVSRAYTLNLLNPFWLWDSFHLVTINSSTDELNGLQKNGGKTLLMLEIPLQQKSGKVNLLEDFSYDS